MIYRNVEASKKNLEMLMKRLWVKIIFNSEELPVIVLWQFCQWLEIANYPPNFWLLEHLSGCILHCYNLEKHLQYNYPLLQPLRSMWLHISQHTPRSARETMLVLMLAFFLLLSWIRFFEIDFIDVSNLFNRSSSSQNRVSGRHFSGTRCHVILGILWSL